MLVVMMDALHAHSRGLSVLYRKDLTTFSARRLLSNDNSTHRFGKNINEV
jgi:hypothetical protein